MAEKPKPQKHAECDQCEHIKPLLMPFGLIPGWPIVVWQMLCMDCRTTQQVSRHWDRYCVPAYHFEHPRDPRRDAEMRATYQEWLASESI